MDSFVEHLLDGLSLGAIYGLLATAYSLASCAGRSLVFANAAACLLGAAVSLMTLTASVALGVRFESVAVLIAFAASIAAVFASGWVIGANLQVFAPRQRGFIALLAPVAAVTMAAAALDFANNFPLTNYLRPSPPSRLVFGMPGLFQSQIAPEKLVIIIAGAVLFTIVLRVTRSIRFGRDYRAISQDRAMAELFGIEIARVDFVTVLISIGVAGIAGWMMVFNGAAVDVNDGVLAAGIAFAAAVLAGLASVRRAAAGGFVAGMATALLSDFVSPAYGAPIMFIILLFLLAFSPSRFDMGRLTEEI